MKVQFVFSSFLVCSLVGELFGELVEESDFVVLDNADSIPERRAAVYDPGCVKVPDSKAYPRPVYPRRNSKYLSQKSSPYSKKFPRYQDNFINSPIGGSNNFKNLPDFGSYSYSGKRFPPSNNNGKGQRYPFRPKKNLGTDGPFVGADKGKRSGKVYMMSLRDNKGREVYRRMLDAAEAEEEDEIEEPQDY